MNIDDQRKGLTISKSLLNAKDNENVQPAEVYNETVEHQTGYKTAAPQDMHTETVRTQTGYNTTGSMPITPEMGGNVPTAGVPDTGSDEKKPQTTKKNKNKLIHKGKDAAVSFVIKKIVTSVLSAALGAVMVLITQHSFKDNMKDYINNYYENEVASDFSELEDYVLGVGEMNFDEAVEYFEEHRIYKKSKDLLETVVTYSSNDKEVNELHNQLTDVCKDIHRLSYMCYFAAESNEDITVEYKTSYQVIVDKMEVFMETRDEFLEKHDIKLRDVKE